MKKTTRKTFIKQSAALAAIPFVPSDKLLPEMKRVSTKDTKFPLVISTWSHGMAANEGAWELLSKGKTSLDAVEAGVMVSEADPRVSSVGYGGLPDASGKVSLDACIMDHYGNCGSVSFLENILHPISVARKVMQKTPHVMLCGEGAFIFALENGFEKFDLLTNEAKAAYEKWLEEESGKKIDKDNHDTIGMLAIDEDGEMAGACTTSGLAWKIHGRVGDSPIIGAGLFVDGEVGAATATGKGESVIKIAGTAVIVELMRQGKSPQEACETAIKRIIAKQKDHRNFQVGFLAVNRLGETGAYALQKGFQYALYRDGKNELIDSDYYLK